MTTDLYNLGLLVINEFITENEEQEILSSMENKFQTREKGVSVMRFGPTKPYHSGIISDKIPDYLQKLSDRIVERGVLEKMPRSISINEYKVGKGMDPHIDNQAAGPIITILSLSSDAIMEFSLKEEKIPILLPKRSLIQMKNEVRTKWKHSVLPVEKERYSVIFRCS